MNTVLFFLFVIITKPVLSFVVDYKKIISIALYICLCGFLPL